MDTNDAYQREEFFNKGFVDGKFERVKRILRGISQRVPEKTDIYHGSVPGRFNEGIDYKMNIDPDNIRRYNGGMHDNISPAE